MHASIRHLVCWSLLSTPILPADAAAQNPFSSSSGSSALVDCSGLELVSAGGVPDGDRHKYAFQGVCRLLRRQTSTDKVAGIAYDNDVKTVQVGTAWVRLETVWDRKTAQLHEQLKAEGTHPGTMSSVFKCGQDPVIAAKVPCHPVSHDNSTGWAGYDESWHRAVPFSATRAGVQHAAALSSQGKQGGANPPPPPPKPQPKPDPEPKPVPLGTFTPIAPTARDQRPVGSQPGPPNSHSTDRRLTEVALERGTSIALEDGRTLGGRISGGELRWVLLSSKNERLRVFPVGSRVLRAPDREVVVDYGKGVYRAGKARSFRTR